MKLRASEPIPDVFSERDPILTGSELARENLASELFAHSPEVSSSSSMLELATAQAAKANVVGAQEHPTIGTIVYTDTPYEQLVPLAQATAAQRYEALMAA